MNMKTNSSSRTGLISPDPLLQFIFAMFGLLTWLGTMVKMTPDAKLVMGILQLALGTGAFVGSVLNLIKGDPHGNINLILSVILGFAGGVTQICAVAASAMKVYFHPWIMSVILLVGGLYMACFLPLLNKKPFYMWCSHLFVVLGFLCNSLSDLLFVPFLKVIGAWCLFVFALTGLYGGVSMMYMEAGESLPQGPTASDVLHHRSVK